MSKALIITEKPSVARDITAALGGFKSVQGGEFYESADYLCSYAVGHLFSFLEPQDLDPRFKRWDLSHLPILPKPFRMKPHPKQSKRIGILKKLLSRKDVSLVINACDAAREGELIFRELMDFTLCDKPTQRLWLQSMTAESILRGMKQLKSGSDYDGLGAAAACRARSDWLIGMNATRAFSKKLQTRQDSKPWSVGRVQTPTLALLVERELEVLSHVPRPFFRVKGLFTHKLGSSERMYESTWYDPGFSADEGKPHLKDDRIFGREKAEEVLKAMKEIGEDAFGQAEDKVEESQRRAPRLFNLTALQKTMNMRFKWNGQRTLKAAQRCYEQHKVLTYPRTSSTCLPNDYRSEVNRLIGGMAKGGPYESSALKLQKNGLENQGRTFNDAGVTDHFAIIPTGNFRSLSGDDQKLFDTVVRRFLANFFPPAIYDKIKRRTMYAGHHFRSGPEETLRVPGWLEVYGKTGSVALSQSKNAPQQKAGSTESKDKRVPEPLIPLESGENGKKVRAEGGSLEEKETLPPPRISEAKLLTLMEFAGRAMEDEDLAAALMNAEGLGTAATRADIIQNLIVKEYTDLSLRPKPKGIRLIETLKRLDNALLTSPKLTAGLEVQLKEVEQGGREEKTYMGNITQYTKDIVRAAKELNWKNLYPDSDPLGKCPNCSRPVFERSLMYSCESVKWPDPGCGWQLWKEFSGRYLDRSSVGILLKEGETHELEGFKNKQQKDLEGKLLRTKTGAQLVDRLGKPIQNAVPLDLDPMHGKAGGSSGSNLGPGNGAGVSSEPVGACPIHKGNCVVVETRGAYVCETRRRAYTEGNEQEKGILIAKVLCKRTITIDEVKAFLDTGATPYLKNFISKKGRPFEARLTLTPSGKPAFDFPNNRQGASQSRGSAPAKKKWPRKKSSPKTRSPS